MSGTIKYNGTAPAMQGATGCAIESAAATTTPGDGCLTPKSRKASWFINHEGHPVFTNAAKHETWEGPFTSVEASVRTGISLDRLHTDTFQAGDSVIYKGDDYRMRGAASAKVVGFDSSDEIGRSYEVEFTYEPPIKTTLFGSEITISTQVFALYPHEISRS